MSTTLLLQTLKEKGYKVTPRRMQILKILHDSGKRMTAGEIYSRLRKKQPGISIDTVYRNLRLMTKLGLVHQISLQSGSIYEPAGEPAHHHHLVCIDCEKVLCIPYCPDFGEYHLQARRAGFSVLGHSLELFGRCSGCRKTEMNHG